MIAEVKPGGYQLPSSDRPVISTRDFNDPRGKESYQPPVKRVRQIAPHAAGQWTKFYHVTLLNVLLC